MNPATIFHVQGGGHKRMVFDKNSGRPNEGPFRGWAFLAIGITAAGDCSPPSTVRKQGLRRAAAAIFVFLAAAARARIVSTYLRAFPAHRGDNQLQLLTVALVIGA
jgi:hypothetical protein